MSYMTVNKHNFNDAGMCENCGMDFLEAEDVICSSPSSGESPVEGKLTKSTPNSFKEELELALRRLEETLLADPIGRPLFAGELTHVEETAQSILNLITERLDDAIKDLKESLGLE